MKNLGNYGVQELNTKEIRETEGGFWVPLVVTIYLALALYAHTQHH